MSQKHKGIRCGGGGLLLADGHFAFFLELHIGEESFHFESKDTWETDKEMNTVLNHCMEEFPKIVKRAAEERTLKPVENFCQQWNLIKVVPEELVNEEDFDIEELPPEEDLH